MLVINSFPIIENPEINKKYIENIDIKQHSGENKNGPMGYM